MRPPWRIEIDFSMLLSENPEPAAPDPHVAQEYAVASHGHMFARRLEEIKSGICRALILLHCLEVILPDCAFISVHSSSLCAAVCAAQFYTCFL